MAYCRTLAEVIAAADARDDPPLTQEQADLVAEILATQPAAALTAA